MDKNNENIPTYPHGPSSPPSAVIQYPCIGPRTYGENADNTLNGAACEIPYSSPCSNSLFSIYS